MTDDAPRNPFAVVDPPNRSQVESWRGWTNALPLPSPGTQLVDGVWVESLAEVIYQLPKRGR